MVICWACQEAATSGIEKETLAQVFSCDFCEIFKNIFFTEHLRATASAYPQEIIDFQEHSRLKNCNIVTLAGNVWNVVFVVVICFMLSEKKELVVYDRSQQQNEDAINVFIEYFTRINTIDDVSFFIWL